MTAVMPRPPVRSKPPRVTPLGKRKEGGSQRLIPTTGNSRSPKPTIYDFGWLVAGSCGVQSSTDIVKSAARSASAANTAVIVMPSNFFAPDFQNATSDTTEEEAVAAELDDFLEGVYAHADDGKVRPAIVSIIDYVDRLLAREALSVCNQLLQKVDFVRIPSSVRRAFLTITYPAKDDLPARKTAYALSLALLTRERGEETAKRMLRTLG